MPENNSPPIETIERESTQSQSSQSKEIIFTGSPYCQHKDKYDVSCVKNAIARNLISETEAEKTLSLIRCSNRSVPGSNYCGPHGGKLTLRSDGTLGIIGPGAYRAIAQLANLNNRYVSQVLQGKANPTSSVLDRIAKVVGISVERLVRYIEEQKLDQ